MADIMRSVLPLTLCLLAPACGERDPDLRAGPQTSAAACDSSAARLVVERLGQRMKDVALLAPDSVVRRDMREAYGDLVTPELLDAWRADPASAPGRQVSSPWPDRIEIRSLASTTSGECRVEGDVVYVSSADAGAGGALRERVVLHVRETDGWRVGAYDHAADETGSGSASAGDGDSAAAPAQAGAEAAAAVIEQYYSAINARDFRRAYALWSDAGAASGQSFEEFTAGFAETAQVRVEIGAAGRVEGAAGSRYVRIPVVIRASRADGSEQHFAGTYTLRRSVVDGATPAQRAWRIHAADVAAVRAGADRPAVLP